MQSANVIPQAPLRHRSPQSVAPDHPSAESRQSLIESLHQTATTIRARRRQQLPLSNGDCDVVYVIGTGFALLETAHADNRRQILALFYPGDIVHAGMIPPFPVPVLATATASEMWRMPLAVFESRVANAPQIALAVHRQLADKQSRDVLHIAMIGTLDGEERVASFLIELALRVGSPSANGVSFEIPLSRTEIADYLSLNPDTLSRIMSRLKSRGLVMQTGRGRALLPDWKALCARSPIAEPLIAVHQNPDIKNANF